MVSCSHCGVRNKKCVLVSREHYEQATLRGTSPSRPQLCHKCIKALNIPVPREQAKNIPNFYRNSINQSDPQKNHPTQSRYSSPNAEQSCNSFSVDPQGPQSAPCSENSQGQNPAAAQQSPLTLPFITAALLPPAGDSCEESSGGQQKRQMNASAGLIANSSLQQLEPISLLIANNLSTEFLPQTSSSPNTPLILIPLLFPQVKNIITLPVTRVESPESEKISITIVAEKNRKRIQGLIIFMHVFHPCVCSSAGRETL